MLHEAGRTAASAVTVGLAISVLPILLRVLPPLPRNERTRQRGPELAWTVVALLPYVALVTAVIVSLNV